MTRQVELRIVIDLDEPGPVDLSRFELSKLYIEFGDSSTSNHSWSGIAYDDEYVVRNLIASAEAKDLGPADEYDEEPRRVGHD